jgi:hypothetical protein
MLWPSRKKRIAKTTISRNCPIPNEGGLPPVFNELAIELILAPLVNVGAATIKELPKLSSGQYPWAALTYHVTTNTEPDFSASR